MKVFKGTKQINKLIILQRYLVVFLTFVFQLINSSIVAQNNENEKEIWLLEKHYWIYLEANDTTSCKKLWTNNCFNYQPNDENQNKINIYTDWIDKIHGDASLEFSYVLHMTALEESGNKIITYYNVDKFWMDKQHNLYKSETFSFSHTWIKSKNSWLIAEGFAIKK